MSETEKTIRLSKVKAELSVPPDRMISFLQAKGFQMDSNPNQKISEDMYTLLQREFAPEREMKEEAKTLNLTSKLKKETITIEEDYKGSEARKEREDEEVVIKDLNKGANIGHVREVKPAEKEPAPVEEPVKEVKAEEEPVKPKAEPAVAGVKVVGNVDLDAINSKTKPDKKGKAKKEEKEPAKAEEKEIKAEKEEKPKKAATKKEEKEKEKEKEVTAEAEITAPDPVAEVQPDAAAPTEEKPEAKVPKEEELYRRPVEKVTGPKIMGKIELPVEPDKKKPIASSSSGFEGGKGKKKRKRINKGNEGTAAAPPSEFNRFKPGQSGAGTGPPRKGPTRSTPRHELTEVEIQAQIKETLARLSGNTGKSKAAKYRKEKRSMVSQKMAEEVERQEQEKSVLKVTEFVSASQLASMMNLPVTQIISTCMNLGMFVSINQRLDAETISIVAEEFGFKVEFVSVEVQEAINDKEDTPEELLTRPPIVTVMGHVDHGKTSLLDYIRKANVIAGEAGGITQHIGAYRVTLENGKDITFLDTPGHEAFTAMRARGAQVTDIAIIVIAADDSVMPQTKEAINHAQAANVPMVFAINKVDKPGANPDNIRQALAQMNILVEEWGGKFQCQEISAKKGTGITELLDKVLLEAEILDLKANPERNAAGSIIESTLDKGRGYTSTILVAKGTLRVGDVILAGCYSGRVKAMQNERGAMVKIAGPAMPVQILGLNGAPQAGDKFNVMDDEREAREIATKRLQLQREQGIRTQKHITLDEIGRRLAIGDFKELNIIVKGDVDGSIEALTDSLQKLSSEKIVVNIIHKSVGAISESDVLLASASNAIIVGFQVRPSTTARKLAETEQIDIRLYSIIYDAINEIKAAMEGMLAPEFEEKIVCNIEIREVFNITKVGTIAGCMVLDGKVTRNTKVRIIRDGIVIHSGSLGSLKRFKDDVKEVATGFECGLNIQNFNDIKVGDIVEGYDMVEIKAKL
jgi:translation initiation factor IF-2